MKKYSMRAISAAAATVAVLAFGMQAHAQSSTTTPPGSTNTKDAVSPAPMGGNGTTGRMGAEANNSSGNPVAKSATMTPGTTNPKDNVSPSPTAGSGKSARMAAPGMNEANAANPNQTGIGGTTNSKDNVSPSPMGGMAKTADARMMSKEEKASAKAAKRAARKARMNNNASASTTSQTPGGAMGSTALSPSK
ncbi:MAG: hypothetical protein H7228_11720 [Polaromonas sp.]|nr:hypothetical protein [Polaromonas sp.]